MARELTWFKSSFSESQEHQTCVEVALTARLAAVRDSKAPRGGRLGLPLDAWSALLTTLRDSAE